MILPAGFDPENPPDDAVEQLVASGAYTEEQAEALVELLKNDPDFVLE